MKLIRQPKKSRLCGQACVAMLAGLRLKESVWLFGHSHGTRTQEVARALRRLGFQTDGRLKVIPAALDPEEYPRICIVKFRHIFEPKGGWHWVLWFDGRWLDPSGDNSYQRTAKGWQASSLLEIKNDQPLLRQFTSALRCVLRSRERIRAARKGVSREGHWAS